MEHREQGWTSIGGGVSAKPIPGDSLRYTTQQSLPPLRVRETPLIFYSADASRCLADPHNSDRGSHA